MHKEVLFAIFFGSLLGLVVAFGVWKANVAIKSTDQKESITSENTQTNDKSNDENGLTVLKPNDKSVSASKSITVSGIASPKAIVAITSESDDTFAIASDTGEFNGTVELIGGINTIEVIAIKEDGSQKRERLIVAYSSELATDTTKESSESADLAKDLDRRMREATESASVYLGIITDITESTIQLRDLEGEIKQISLSSKDTSYVNTIKTAKEVQFKDVAIGDFVAALGKVNGNEVLSAKRVIITNALKETGRIALMGKVTTIAKKEIDITTIGKEDEWAIDTSTGVDVYTASDSAAISSKYTKIKEDMTVVVTAEKDDDEVTARAIFTLP